MEEINAIRYYIRSDIEQILLKPETDFQKWYSERKEATERILHDYELFASIPNLSYESPNHDMRSITAVGFQLEALKEGLRYLEAIYQERKTFKIKNPSITSS